MGGKTSTIFGSGLTDHTKLLFTLLQNIKKCGRQAERSYDTGVCGLKKK